MAASETAQPLVFRWGIISTGTIASVFVKEILIDPKTRETYDVIHKVTAVASRSLAKAQTFIDTIAHGDKSIKAYGSYEDIYVDENVDAVYIGTPHSHHYPVALGALNGGKHVLCEKPVTLNAPELRSLLAVASARKLFFMEAMWTRFLPIVRDLQAIVQEKDLGAPLECRADLSFGFTARGITGDHRLLNPALGGGALLDLGPYPLVWAIIALYEHPAINQVHPTVTKTQMTKSPLTGVDTATGFELIFPRSDGSECRALLTCSISREAVQGPQVTIRYERGTIEFPWPTYCPKSFTLRSHSEGGEGEPLTVRHDFVGGGWHFQADEVARCVARGETESTAWSWGKSLLEMKVFDEVRRQGGYAFPEGVEAVV